MDEQLVARSYGLHLRALRTESREADFVASTEAIDSYDEVVEQSWDLERYGSNPVVLFAHQSRELPIGRATRVAVVNGQLEATIQFATAEMNPKADQVFRMVQAKMLNAVSVGFVPRDVRLEKRDGRDIYVLGDNELHEISVVPIPANPEALAKMKAKALAEAKVHAAPAAKEEYMKTVEQLMAEIAERDSKYAAEKAVADKNLADAQSALAAEKAVNSALDTQNKALVAERDAAVARAEKAEAGLIEAEVEALVGVKITPAEKDDFIALRKSNPELYARFVSQRADLKLAQPVIPVKSAPVVSLSASDEPDLLASA